MNVAKVISKIKILCFEPQRSFKELKTNIKKNNIKNIKIFNIGLSNFEGNAKICIDNNDQIGAYIKKRIIKY